jgi:hypothetical protein
MFSVVKLSVNIPSSGEIDAYFDSSKNRSFVNIVIAGIDNAFGVWPPFLCCSDCCPKDSFSPTTSVTT